MIDLRKKIKKACPFTHIFENKGQNGRPKNELAYFRCDYDGYRWWNTVWQVNKSLEDPELIEEFDSVLNSFYKAFPSRTEMERFCMQSLTPTSDPTEYNAYLDLGGPGYYWLRMITRKGDYNLYLHCYCKDMPQIKNEV